MHSPIAYLAWDAHLSLRGERIFFGERDIDCKLYAVGTLKVSSWLTSHEVMVYIPHVEGQPPIAECDSSKNQLEKIVMG
jgi:hypothetical protein